MFNLHQLLDEDWKFFMPELLRQILDDDRRLDVNDLLRFFFGLSRRGGVGRGSRSNRLFGRRGCNDWGRRCGRSVVR